MTLQKLPLVIYPDEILKTPCAEVTTIDQDLVDFIGAMNETMYGSNGIGLAAPQVARNIRVMTVDVEPDRGGAALMHLINPVIVEAHGRTVWEEGCLSFPGLAAEVKRRKSIHVQGYDMHGKLLDFEAEGLLSICIQHEMDHLNGVVFVDRLNPVQKKIVLRGYLREREIADEEAVIDAIRQTHLG